MKLQPVIDRDPTEEGSYVVYPDFEYFNYAHIRQWQNGRWRIASADVDYSKPILGWIGPFDWEMAPRLEFDL